MWVWVGSMTAESGQDHRWSLPSVSSYKEVGSLCSSILPKAFQYYIKFNYQILDRTNKILITCTIWETCKRSMWKNKSSDKITHHPNNSPYFKADKPLLSSSNSYMIFPMGHTKQFFFLERYDLLVAYIPLFVLHCKIMWLAFIIYHLPIQNVIEFKFHCLGDWFRKSHLPAEFGMLIILFLVVPLSATDHDDLILLLFH